MKRSEELLELAVISIDDGKEIGRVCDIVINPSKGAVEHLVIDNGSRYTGVKILPFKLVEGVGEYAVTVQSLSSITDLDDEPDVNGLLEKNVRVKGTKVLTKKGKLIGSVSEYLIDDSNEGKIAACEVVPVDGGASSGMISADQIITFGKDVLIVGEEAVPVPPEGGPGVSTEVAAASAQSGVNSNPQQAKKEDDAGRATTIDRQEQSQAAKLFEEKQRQYLLGRKLSKRLENESGELIAEDGELITEDILNKAKDAGKFTELSMNTKS